MNNGISNSIAMSQSRVREIETIIHPFGHGGVGSHLGIPRLRARVGLISR